MTALRATATGALAPGGGDLSAVAALVGPEHPNRAFVHGVLEGRIAGEVWIGGAGRRPSVALVTTASPYCFLVGAVTPRALDEARAILARRAPLVLVPPPGPALGGAPAGFEVRRRVAFHTVAGHPEPPPDPLDHGFELVRLGAGAFHELGWKEMVHSIFGDARAYERHHFGFGIRHHGRLVAEAHAVVGGGHGEVGIHTDPGYRRGGLSRAALSEVVRHGLRTGLEMTATFDVDAAASRALAHHLRLEGEREYEVLARVPTGP